MNDKKFPPEPENSGKKKWNNRLLGIAAILFGLVMVAICMTGKTFRRERRLVEAVILIGFGVVMLFSGKRVVPEAEDPEVKEAHRNVRISRNLTYGFMGVFALIYAVMTEQSIGVILACAALIAVSILLVLRNKKR